MTQPTPDPGSPVVVPTNPIVAILQSRKYLVYIVAMACVTVLVALGKIDTTAFMDFAKWAFIAVIGAQATEDSAKHFANRPTSVNISNSS